MEWNTNHIDLQNLINLSHGDSAIVKKYLRQFQELIPQRIESLKKFMETEDRTAIRQMLHKMSPQLQFFGIAGVHTPIRRLELEYQTMSSSELKALVNDLLAKLQDAVNEVKMILG